MNLLSRSWWRRILGLGRGKSPRSEIGAHGPEGQGPPEPIALPERTALPEWAARLGSLDALRRFEEAVLEAFGRWGRIIEMHEGMLSVARPGEEPFTAGLGSLAQQCAAIPTERWPEFIGEHVRVMREAAQSRPIIERMMTSYERARERLVVRLWDEQDLPPDFPLVTRSDIPGLRTVLCVDLPESIRTVHADEAAKWGIPIEQAFARAVDNLALVAEPEFHSIGGDADSHLVVIASGHSDYISSLALVIERFHDRFGPHGVWVSVPTRGMLVLMPFLGGQTLGAVGGLIGLTNHAFETGPGSVSRRVFWFHEGKWLELPYRVRDGQIHAAPGVEFIQALHARGLNPDEEP